MRRRCLLSLDGLQADTFSYGRPPFWPWISSRILDDVYGYIRYVESI